MSAGARSLLLGLQTHAWWWLPGLLLLSILQLQSRFDLSPYRLRFHAAAPCGERLAPLSEPLFRLSARGDCWLYLAPLELALVEPSVGALLLGGVSRDVGIYINGVQIRSIDTRLQQNHASTNLYLPVGLSLLRASGNELLIELRGSPRSDRVHLHRAYFGPGEALFDWQLRFRIGQEYGAQLCFVLLLAVMVFLLPMLLSRPKEPLYRHYATGLFGALLYVSTFVSVWRPLEIPWSHALTHGGLLLSLYGMLRFSQVLVGAPAPRALLPLLLTGAAAMAASVGPWPGLLKTGSDLLFRGISLGFLLHLLGLWWRHRRAPVVPDGRWFAAACVLLLVLGLSDSLRVLLGMRWIAQGYLLHWAILYLVTLMFVALIVNLLSLLQRSESNREQLASALDERSRELTAEFQRRQAAEAARLLAEERQRIMRDMHDGVGGQLVALIGRLGRGDATEAVASAALRQTLEDLRLMIDSLDSACADLSVALGMLRSRLDPLLAGQPTALQWRTAHLPDLPPVSPSIVLNALRVVQEAITNALKHAGARVVRIEAEWDGHRLRLDVADDGQGGAAGFVAGRGLIGMRRRAEAMGATLQIESDGAGTRVRLELPLVESATAPSRPV